MQNPNVDSSVDQQARDLFAAHQQIIFIHTDRMFAVLMSLQWLGAIAVSLWLSPKTWAGAYSTTSNNVWAAFILGGVLSIYPIFLALTRPGHTSTRYVIAISQMMMSALLIHLTGGRIETHFHVFGSLAFLSFYRDWRVLVPSTAIVAADHILRGIFWPQSVYGVLVQQEWRWAEHAWWVLFEDAFLFIAIKRSVSEMWESAKRTSQLETSNKYLENEIAERRRLQTEAEVISQVIQGVTTTSNLNELFELIHRSIGKILYAENCSVVLFDPTTEMLDMQFFVDKYDPIPTPLKLGIGLTAYVFRKGLPMLLTREVIHQLSEAGEVQIVGTIPPIWLGVPLRTPEGIIGVLVVQHYEDAEAYDQRDVGFLSSVGDQIALAIERKRAEEQLKIFNNKLQKSNRELQDFAYVASHDLQEPLRKVQAFSDRLKTKYTDRLEGDGLDYLERMRSAANRMQLLIQDLLTFSRVSTKEQPFTIVDLATVTEEVLSDLEVKIEETGATVEIKDLPVIDADPLQMRQLIQNLVGNALKFRRNDTAPIISVQSRQADSDSDGWASHCQIVVKDNGIGFDEKYTDKIFAVFQRLHGRTEYEGSGVGLAICRKIVERHNGNITAHSQAGDGSTFIVTLPLKQSLVEIDQ